MLMGQDLLDGGGFAPAPADEDVRITTGREERLLLDILKTVGAEPSCQQQSRSHTTTR